MKSRRRISLLTPALLTMAVAAAAGEPAGVDFDTQLMPVFTRAGCNAGSCHGAAIGRGGFKLSLLGGDPAADYDTIVHELEGRRVNLARPDESLLLAKPTGLLEHGGGYCLEYEGEGATLIEAWIAAGAPRMQSRRLAGFEVEPQRLVASLEAEVPIKATASFDDGSREDVTRWTVFTPADPAAVELDEATARAVLRRRGQHVVIARYLDRVVPLQLIVPLADEPVELSGAARANFIDEHILAALETLRLPVSPPADDATFLRRARLDLTGRLPQPDEVRAFLADGRDDKRAALIDRLLASDDFTEYWTYSFAKLLRIRTQPKDPQGARTFHDWLRAQIEGGRPYDQFARELIVAEGDTHQVGPANFYRVVGGARDQAEYVSELFMGARLRCANCHNHPLDRWTQDDYHGLAAVFARIERGQVIRVGRRGEVTHPRTGEAAVPRIPGERFLPADGDGRAALADWLTSADNRHFARAIVNRLWKHLMGRGLIEPTDDLRDTNPATHPALLDALAEDFVTSGYDLRHTLRTIARSAAYARGAAIDGNRGDAAFYSHAIPKPLEPEVLADALSDVTGVAEKYGDEPAGTRAVALFDPDVPSTALDVLGRCSRRESCETPSGEAAGLPTKLHLINGPLVNAKLTDPEGRLCQLLDAGRTNEQIAEEFYLRALGRLPDDKELAFWKEALAKDDPQQRRKVLEDFVWSLVNCREFGSNH